MKIEISDDKSSATIDGVEYELKQKGKKISEWLNELPDGYRELALANFKEQGYIDDITSGIEYAIFEAFNFFETKEGGEFWILVNGYYFRKENDLPPLPKPKFEVWKPKVGEVVWFNNINGEAIECRYSKENVLYRFFQTKEQAIEAHEKAMFNYEVEMFIKEKNEGWLPDWTNEIQQKHYLYFNGFNNTIVVKCNSIHFKYTHDSKVYKSAKIGEEIIAKFDNDKLVKWWI